MIILDHDYSWSVLRRAYGDVVAEARKTIIGDNCFIGVNSVILMGAHIGDNCIVGAGSVCRGFFPPNSVIAGNPAKVIDTLDNYYEKRKQKYIDEAKEYCWLFFDRHNRWPSVHEMGGYFPIYLERSRQALQDNNIRTNLSGDVEEEVISAFLNSKAEYDGYQAFLEDVKKKRIVFDL